jgi:uncharacterized protein Usg
MTTRDLSLQMAGYGLTTAEIHYRMPDHPSLLQTFIWQQYDLAPRFPMLVRLLRHWQQLDGPLHSVRIAHQHLIRPVEWKIAEGMFTLQ